MSRELPIADRIILAGSEFLGGDLAQPPNVAALSARGKNQIVDCGHSIPASKPEAVISTVNELLEEIRATAVPLVLRQQDHLMLNVARAVLALLTLCAIGLQLSLHLAASFSALNFFSYFTNLANLFAASVLLIAALSGGRGRADRLRYASAVNMTIVGLVFVVLLRDTDLGALLPWVNVVLHYVMPLAVVVDWLLAPPTRRLGARAAAFNLVFPALYLTYVLIRGAHIGWYPYPFLNPATAGGYGHVALYALGIAVTFLMAGAALRQAGNYLGRARRLDAG